MKGTTTKNEIIRQLQKDILALQGFKRSSSSQNLKTGVSSIEAAFPEQVFPTGVIHEFLSYTREEAAATGGFIGGLLGRLMQQKGACLWISTKRTLFPPSLKLFGIEPERIIFIDLSRQKEALWAIEEGLKCKSLSCVVGELPELSFTESRRLQLAVESSCVTGFIHRKKPKAENTTACITRWKIKPIVSETEGKLPGLGFPRWHVELAKVRNGIPGSWQIEWVDGMFQHIDKPAITISETLIRKTG